MDERPDDGPDALGTEPVDAPEETPPALDAPGADQPGGPALPTLGSLSDPKAQALAEEGAEIRRLIDAGAGSPEDLRALAARLREHRAREDALWRSEIRPVLRKEAKGRLRGHPASITLPDPVETPRGKRAGWVALALLVLVLMVALAASTSIWVLLVPLVGLLGWAWAQGRST